MKLYMPKSFFTLLLTGFLFVSLPLLAALYGSMRILDDLILKSNVTVYHSVDLATSSRKLTDLLLDEERKARMFHVLKEPQQLQNLNNIHNDVVKTLDYLTSFNSNGKLPPLISEVRELENRIITVLNSQTVNPRQTDPEKEQVLSLYKDISNLAVNIVKLSNRMMFDEVEGLKDKVSQDKERLIRHTSYLISFAVLLIIVFMALLSKPIRQINNGIESLGDGNFSKPINVSGPKDLQDLGWKLDWLRKRLAKLDKEKIKLIAHISHDIKTPLSSIKEGASLLQDELVGPMSKDQKEVVEILNKNCTKLHNLIENILNFNMAQARSIPDEKYLIKLDDMIHEVVSDHRNSILAGNIKLDVQLGAIKVFGNHKQLKSVFDNLLSNAVKFTPDGGTIRISLKAEGKAALCLIEDSGPGINEEDRSQIFSPFFQGKGSAKATMKGYGLGLAISKEYVQNHHGSIQLLNSKNGARFLVTLPISE